MPYSLPRLQDAEILPPATNPTGGLTPAGAAALYAPIISPQFSGNPLVNGVALISANAVGTASNPVNSQTAARPVGLTRVYWAYASAIKPANWLPGDIFEDIS